MPISSDLHGDAYYPTPVSEHYYGQNSISESVSSAAPFRSGQRSNAARKKGSKNLKRISSKTKWSRRKKVTVGLIIAAILVAIIVAVVLLAVFLTRKSNSSTTAAPATVITAYWTFDAVTNDYYGVYNGTLINNASYFSTSNTQPYVGYGRGLALVSTSSQYFTVTSPFLDLSYKSFTIEARIYPSLTSAGDFGIFSTFQCYICPNQGLYFIIRSYQLFISFTNNDLSGVATFASNTWYHIAFVYDNNAQQQILYVNGVRDAVKSAASYQGTSGALLIGAGQVYSTTSYFNGYIDNFKITTRAKSAAEILTAATLTAYFPFDYPNTVYDSGPNGLNGSYTNALAVPGRVNQALRFPGPSSYFQAYGFYQMGYAVTNTAPFTVALWINPLAALSCTIVQVSPYLSGNCHNLIGLVTYLGITSQIIVQGCYWPYLYGPVAPLNSWTHIALTYSLTNGLTLYVNGAWIGNTGTFTFAASGSISYIQLGYYTSCNSAYITNTPYQGSVDELYVYSRELAQSEVTALANP